MRQVSPILLALLLASVPAAAGESRGARPPASVDRPETIFHNYCSVCHGEKGDGKSIARFSLDPPPADFTSEKTRERLSRAHMIETLRTGARTEEGKRTGMMPWTTQLSPAHIEAVVDYVIITFMNGKVAPNRAASSDDPRHRGHNHLAFKQVDYPYGLKANPEQGKSLYGETCAGCHGDTGDGKGRVALERQIKPRNFRDADFREFATGFSLYAAVSRGDGHTPAFEKTLGRQAIADVSEYVLKEFVKPRRVPGKRQ